MNITTVMQIQAQVSGQQAVEAMRTGVAQLATAYDRVSLAAGQVKNAMNAVAATAAVAMLKEVVSGAVEFGAQVDLLSQRTGVSADALGKWINAGKLVNVSAEDIGKGFMHLSKDVMDALTNSTGKAAAAFNVLKISTADLKSGDLNAIALKLVDAFNKMPAGAEKTSLAAQLGLISKSGTELLPVLTQTVEGINDATSAMTQGFADKSELFTEQWEKIKEGFTDTRIEIADGLLPSLIDVQKSFLDTTGSGDALKTFFEGIGTVIRTVDFAIQGITNTLGAFKDIAQDAIEWAVNAGFMGTGAATDIANAQWKSQISGRMEMTQKSNADLWAHDPVVGSMSTPYDKNNAAARSANGISQDDIDQLSKGNDIQKSADAYQQETAKILAEASAVNMSNLAKKESLATLDLENTGLDENSKQYQQLAASRTAALTALDSREYEDQLKKITAASQEQIQALKDEAAAANMTAVQLANLKDARETDKATKDAVLKMSPENGADFQMKMQQQLQQRDAQRQLTSDGSQTFQYGADKFTTDYTQTVNNTAQQTEQIMKQSFDGMTNALTTFITTGKVQFQSFIASVLSGMAKIALEKSIMGPLASAFGSLFGSASGGAMGPFQPGSTAPGAFAKGGIMTSRGPIPLRQYAGGGIASSPQMAVFGEGSNPEAYVPLPDGRSIPVNMRGGVPNQGGGGDTNLEMHFHMADGSTKTKGEAPDNTKQLGVMLSAAVRSVIIDESRSGGLLSSSPTGR